MTRRKVADTGDLYPLEKNWHISRGIPLGLIFSFLGFLTIQSAGAAWYFAHQDSRLDAVEKVQITATAIVEKVQAATASQNIETAKLGEKIVAVQASVGRIETLLTKPR